MGKKLIIRIWYIFDITIIIVYFYFVFLFVSLLSSFCFTVLCPEMKRKPISKIRCPCFCFILLFLLNLSVSSDYKASTLKNSYHSQWLLSGPRFIVNYVIVNPNSKGERIDVVDSKGIVTSIHLTPFSLFIYSINLYWMNAYFARGTVLHGLNKLILHF